MTDDETRRLPELFDANILDTAAEPAFDHVTRVAARLFRTPIALVSLVDAERQWFKAHVGLDCSEYPREHAFCAHAIQHDAVFVVPDACADPRFAENPLVTGEPHIRFDAGAQLRTSLGAKLGTLCIIDSEPRHHFGPEPLTLGADHTGGDMIPGAAAHQLHAFVETTQDAVITADSSGRVTSWNRGAALILGYPAAEAVGPSLSDLMPERYRAAHEAGMDRVTQSGHSQGRHRRLHRGRHRHRHARRGHPQGAGGLRPAGRSATARRRGRAWACRSPSSWRKPRAER
ncbi:PAS domain S-box-containing protein [Limimonas halophila]|uniref:PAS domain S-box-containing protein n=1 Tax=Limimonas halophila TaxID=1082479 RepID=A0A1G7SIZ1_9PROT|nr:PAS domain S-box protein [Limimonas halophila]SDG22399.1 PAS domain S-box-containing protein [Limimonas halophila]